MQAASRTLDLMNATQQKQLELNLGKVESRRDRSSEAFIAERLAESPTGKVRLMESICERQNMNRALKRVRENKGAPGIDGMTVEELPGYLVRHWPKIKAQLLTGDYSSLTRRNPQRDRWLTELRQTAAKNAIGLDFRPVLRMLVLILYVFGDRTWPW